MDWLENKVLSPKCLCDYSENGKNYLLMSKIPGKMSCDGEYMQNPGVSCFNSCRGYEKTLGN